MNDLLPVGAWIDLSDLDRHERIFAMRCFGVECIFGLHEDFIDHMNFIMIEYEDGKVFGYAYRRKRSRMTPGNKIDINRLKRLTMIS